MKNKNGIEVAHHNGKRQGKVTCGKDMYNTESHAKAFAVMLKHRGPLRPYQCPVCPGRPWHLTSASPP